VAVLAGTGANSTDEAVYLTGAAEQLGADGTFQVAIWVLEPRYWPPFFVPRRQTRPFASALTNVSCFRMWKTSYATARPAKAGHG
jgi:hypothetical protein